MPIQPRLSRFDLTMIVVSLVIGMGIFKTPAEVAVRTGNEYLFFGVWIFGGLVSLCGALTFAEIGSRYPNAGGFYKTLSYCYHPAVAFMAEWVLAISNIVSVAAVALIGAEYVCPMLMPASLQNQAGVRIITISSVLILYVVNFLGIKMSARVQNVLIIFKIVMILALCTTIFLNDVPAAATPAVIAPGGSMLRAFGLSLVPVFFTYTGYALTINFGGDVVAPQRNTPRAIFAGMAIVLALYLGINYAYIHALGFGGLQQTPTLAAKMAGLIFGSMGYKITSVLMYLSVLAYVNVYFLSNPRVYYAMAEDGILPAIFKKVNPRTQVQEFGMTFFMVAILSILFFADSFGQLLNYSVFFNTIGLVLGASALHRLRRKTRNLDGNGIYSLRFYPWAPLLFIAAYTYVTIVIFAEDPFAAVVCAIAFATGLAIYYGVSRNSSRKS